MEKILNVSLTGPKRRGISFQRCRVHAVEPGDTGTEINLRFIAEDGKQVSDDFDLVVLSVGMEPRPDSATLAKRTGIELTPDGFAATSCFSPVSTSRPGIFACGAFGGPMDIPSSVIQASAAATAAAIQLSEVRYSRSSRSSFHRSVQMYRNNCLGSVYSSATAGQTSPRL